MSDARRRGRLRSLAMLGIATVTAGVLGAGVLAPVVGGVGWAAEATASKLLTTRCDVVVEPAEQKSALYASDGITRIATFFRQDRRDVPLSQIPRAVQDALISTEDRRFYSHHGVDLHGLVRAAVHDTTGSMQGGSTLTMQYVKQVRFFQANTAAQKKAAVRQDLSRKMADAQCALQLEKHYSKAEILDDYFNIAFFGENAYGIQTAAETYFGVPASRLSVDEGALLVGLLQSPTALDPFQHPRAALARRGQVLDNMVGNGELSAAQAAVDRERPLALAKGIPAPLQEGCTSADADVANGGFFCDYALAWLQTHGLTQRQIDTGGLRIVSTLDAGLQNSGQAAIWKSGLNPTSPTALVMPSVDPRTGAVRTMITSRHYGVRPGQTTLPLFTAAYAGAGSTYKYFTALAALARGVQPGFTLDTGNAYTVRNCPTATGATPYTVHNAGSYAPTLPLSDALPESVNTYFVGMEDQLFGCDLSPIVHTALGMGMNHLNAPQASSGLSIAQAVVAQHQPGFTLGFSPTSALELTGAYATVANDGVYCPPTPIAAITDTTGAAVSFVRPVCSRQFPAQVARTMVAMMTRDTSTAEGTAAQYFSSWYSSGGSLVASKTGTDNDDPTGPDAGNGNSALWFVGVTPTLSSAAALVNPTHPKQTITGLPASVSNSGSDVFGAYAAIYWLDAYGLALQNQAWTWPDPSAVPNAMPVPDTVGQDVSTASTTLTDAGFRPVVATTPCGAPQPHGDVGYYAPHDAPPGSTITLCPSSGSTPVGSYAPAPTAAGAPSPTTTRSSAAPSPPSKPPSPSGSAVPTKPGRPKH